MIQTPTTRFVFRSETTCGSPTTTMLESRVAMKIPTVVTVRTTHLYSKRTRTQQAVFFRKTQNPEYKLRPKTLTPTASSAHNLFQDRPVTNAKCPYITA